MHIFSMKNNNYLIFIFTSELYKTLGLLQEVHEDSLKSQFLHLL